MPKTTEHKNLKIVIFNPSTSVSKIAVMLQALPAVKREITICQDAPFFCNLLAMGIIPQEHKGNNAPKILARITVKIFFFLKIFSKRSPGIITSKKAEAKTATRNAGIISSP